MTLRLILLLLVFFCGQLLANDRGPEYELRLLQVIQHIQQLNHEQALIEIRQLTRNYPTGKLAQLVHADLLQARAGVLPAIGGGATSQSRLHDLTFELRQRLAGRDSPAHSGLLPENIISLANNQPYILLFDQSQSRLYVYRNEQGTPVLVSDFYFSIGLKGSGKQKRGDQKTPVGVYHVTEYIDGGDLPDLYGKGAFPVNYPNAWDRRHNRSGDGIWLHGTPSYTYSRAPRASDGCMVVSNANFSVLEQYIDPAMNTPVIVADQVNWIGVSDWRHKQKTLLQALTRWINDRESNIHERYIDHYSTTEFVADGRDYRGWEGHQRWVNRNKKDVNIEYSNLNIFLYPGEHDLVLMQYDQVYQSNILNINSAKEIFWKRQDKGQWKIVYEGVRELQQAGNRLAENNEQG